MSAGRLSIIGALWLVFDFVAGRAASLVVLTLTAAFFAALWWGRLCVRAVAACGRRNSCNAPTLSPVREPGRAGDY
jgi:hypothetical protein